MYVCILKYTKKPINITLIKENENLKVVAYVCLILPSSTKCHHRVTQIKYN